MTYYAHSTDSADRQHWHRLETHLKDTAERAASFLAPFGCADFGRAAGSLHDLGKYTPAFQKRLEGTGRVDHATAGASKAVDRYGPWLGKILAFGIAGHHAGLANGVNGQHMSTLTDRLSKEIHPLDHRWEREVALPDLTPPRMKPRTRETAGFSAAFLIRMVFSALVDADFLDTEAYYGAQAGDEPERGRHPELSDLSERLNKYLDSLSARAEAGAVTALRGQVLDHARSKASEAPGIFTLTVPTGGGKTLTSLAFALEHAVRHQLSRIIYVVPYMSIIEQTATVFREALRENARSEPDFVVEHHSTFDEDQVANREAREKLRLAMENWDAPIVVTTAVQFFESLYSNRPSRCRKLHNIANSVIILDEAQTLPIKYLRPCVTALDELARNWRTSIVLCTATQPALSEEDGFAGGFEHARELAPDPQRLYQALKRTRVCPQGSMDDIQLSRRLCETDQVLCIVNTRRHARELYDSLSDAEGARHLTTLLCARHRRERLQDVRTRLQAGLPVRLIATSLIEAGVDVDFPVVWRAEAGLESIIQAAGRCNREGKAEAANVFVFAPAEGDGRQPPPEIAQYAGVARSIMRRHDDPMSLSAISDYFNELYWLKGGSALDAKGILTLLNERRRDLDFPFETIGVEFQLIESPMVPVIIPYRGADDGDETVERALDELKWVERPGRIARRLQPYVVAVPQSARTALLATQAATVVRRESFGMQFVVLANHDLYRPDVGLTWDDPSFRRVESMIV